MNRLFPLVVAALIGASALLLFTSGPKPSEDPVRRAFARAYGYYVNETNQDYRRARMELAPFAKRLDGSVAFHLDMALIDLAETSQPVQHQNRIVGGKPEYQRLFESAAAHLERARAIDSGNEAVAFNLARAYRVLSPHVDERTKMLEAAERLLKPLVEQERPDAGALIVYGRVLEALGKPDGAREAYERLLALGLDFVLKNQFIHASFKRAQLMSQAGDSQPMEDFLKCYPERDKAPALVLESGRYTAFLKLAEAKKVRVDARAMNWRRVTERTLIPQAGTPRFFIAPDLDNDCRRDLVMNAKDGLRVLRARRSASYEDLTESADLPKGFDLWAAAAGDIDNNGLCDLVVGGPGGIKLLLNATDEEAKSKWKFVDVTADKFGPRGNEAVFCITLWDLDHDGDLDIFVGGEKNRVYRTAIEEPPDGGRFLRFTEIAEQLKMDSPPAAHALMLDVDDDDDSDLLVSPRVDPAQGTASFPVRFENLRELRFGRQDLPVLPGRLEAADVDNDLVEEFAVGGKVLKWSDGKFKQLYTRPALLDLDGDGVIDEKPFEGIELPGPLLHAVGTDINRDGSRDLLVMTEAGLDLYMSQPEQPAGWIDFMPRGFKSNELGIGARLHLFCGDLRIGTTCRDGLVSFGLGKRTVVDAVLFFWTNGVAQGEVLPKFNDCHTVEEREGEVGSCPFLYTFDGKRWHFINDCHSGTPLGLPYMDGKYLPPRSAETIFIPGDRLQAVDGELRIDLAEEFRELFYVDQVSLSAIDHPPQVRPVLDEGFRIFTHQKFAVHGFRELRAPKTARDHKGRDITELVSKRDQRHAVVWDKLDSRFPGLAHKWSIELDFGDLSQAKRVMFVMDGWVEFPTASASIAASQTKSVQFMPPVIEVIGADGKWVMAEKDPGFPAGKGKAVLVDLSGKFPTKDGRIRITSTQRLHWDMFSVTTEAVEPHLQGTGALTVLPVGLLSAEHGWRGVGKRVEESGQPWRYSHDDLETFFRWNQMPMGMLTKYGDVKELLASIDDKYPVLASGDVVRLRFDASGLPPLREGWVRDYCFTTEGWVKDADMNQAVRERVFPLPFHGMGAYPYNEAEKSHPHPEWVKAWFTRPARVLVNPEALSK